MIYTEFPESVKIPDLGRPIKILVSGSRNWLAPRPLESILRRLPPGSTVIHGAAAGVDNIAGDISKRLGLIVRSYEALANGRQWPWAGPARNSEMLAKEHPGADKAYLDFTLFVHEDPELGKGTRDMWSKVCEARPSIPYQVLIGKGR